jgi:hypothetical protein
LLAFVGGFLDFQGSFLGGGGRRGLGGLRGRR